MTDLQTVFGWVATHPEKLKQVLRQNIKILEEKLTDVPALMLTNENPFKLYKLLKENRTPAAAKPGDIAITLWIMVFFNFGKSGIIRLLC